MYDVALFIHLLGVALLVGAVTTTVIATLRAQTVPTVQELRSVTAVTKKIDLVLGPAMLLILAAGLYMVARGGDEGGITWSSGWVDVALVIFLLMAVLGPTVEAGHAKRLLAAAAQVPDGPVPEDLDRLRRNATAVYVSFFGASQILAFLYLMTNKPGLVGSLVACAIAAVISVGLAAWRLRSLGVLPPVRLPEGPDTGAAPGATPAA
jgi:uncharacterized membrane protein